MAATDKRSRMCWAVGHRSCWMPVPLWLPDAPLPRLPEAFLRDYPDRDQSPLQAIAAIHGVPIDCVLRAMVLPNCSPGLPGMPLLPGSVVCSLPVCRLPAGSPVLACGLCGNATAVVMGSRWSLAPPLTEGAVAWICNPHSLDSFGAVPPSRPCSIAMPW